MFYRRTLQRIGCILKTNRNIYVAEYIYTYSQQYVAFDAHIERKHLSDLENGKGNPSLFILLKLCGVFKIKLWRVLKELNV